MKKTKIVLCALIIAITAFGALWTSCNKNASAVAPPLPGNEPMTSVRLVFTNINEPTDVDTAMWTDSVLPDGSTVLDIAKAHATLKTNSSYRVQVFFMDVDSTPIHDITPEIKARANYHFVCFTDSVNIYNNLGSGNLNWTREDYDANNPPLPIGLVDSFWTGADSACGIWETVLHHQPNVKNGSCEPGSSDIQAWDTIYISPKKR